MDWSRGIGRGLGEQRDLGHVDQRRRQPLVGPDQQVDLLFRHVDPRLAEADQDLVPGRINLGEPGVT